MSGTCSLFPPFGDPWPSCLLPSHHENLFEVSTEMSSYHLMPSTPSPLCQTLKLQPVRVTNDSVSNLTLYSLA